MEPFKGLVGQSEPLPLLQGGALDGLIGRRGAREVLRQELRVEEVAETREGEGVEIA